MSRNVYIVAESGVETYWIKHICASESTARKKFKELKISMLQEELESIMVDIDDYNNSKYFYEDCKTQQEKDEHLAFHMEAIQKTIKLYANCTFEKAATSIHDKPVCDIYDLEE